MEKSEVGGTVSKLAGILDYRYEEKSKNFKEGSRTKLLKIRIDIPT